MFKIDRHYIHKENKEEVIRIHECKDLGSGYELTVTWHNIGPSGYVNNRIKTLHFNFISKEDFTQWKEYKND